MKQYDEGSESPAVPLQNGNVAAGNWRNVLKLHSRRVILEIVNFLVNHDWILWLIGRFNGRLNLIKGVFLAYPATKEYGLWFAYPFRFKTNQWNPWLTGFLCQDGKLTFMFAVGATNSQFTDEKNLEQLKRLCARVEKLRLLLKADGKVFAGILPGVLFMKRIIHEAPEADLTAAAVMGAIEQVKVLEALNPLTPIIVLGGKGFIGRRVIKLLNPDHAVSIDLCEGQSRGEWPSQFDQDRVIVVNITLNNAINNYLELMKPGTVVINEVYPEPRPDFLGKLAAKGCHCYHVVGIKAKAFPPFPAAYHGAIPCCAAWPSKAMKVVVRKLV